MAERSHCWTETRLISLTLVYLSIYLIYASGGKTAPAFWPFLKTHIFFSVTCTSYVTSLGWGVGMLTFMLTCVTCTSYVTSLGWGGGDVNVHVNLRHMHILRYVTGLGGWMGVGMLTFMLTCVTCTSYVTSLGWGGGDVNVHVNLRHMHILRYVTGLGGWGC